MSELELRLQEDDSGGDEEDPWVVGEPEADDSGGDPEDADDSGGDPEV